MRRYKPTKSYLPCVVNLLFQLLRSVYTLSLRVYEKVMLSLSLTKHHDVTVVGSWGTAPHILNSSTRLMWTVSFTPRLLYPWGKVPWYPIDRRRDGPQSLSGCYRDKKDVVFSTGMKLRFLGCPAHRMNYPVSLSVVDQTKRFHVVSPTQFSFTLHCKSRCSIQFTSLRTR